MKIEIVTLRGIVPGEYVINVHMYMRRDPSPTTLVTVQLDKINPFSTIMIKRVSLGIVEMKKQLLDLL